MSLRKVLILMRKQQAGCLSKAVGTVIFVVFVLAGILTLVFGVLIRSPVMLLAGVAEVAMGLHVRWISNNFGSMVRNPQNFPDDLEELEMRYSAAHGTARVLRLDSLKPILEQLQRIRAERLFSTVTQGNRTEFLRRTLVYLSGTDVFRDISAEYVEKIDAEGGVCYRTVAEIFVYGDLEATAFHVKLVFTRIAPGGGVAHEVETHFFGERMVETRLGRQFHPEPA